MLKRNFDTLKKLGLRKARKQLLDASAKGDLNSIERVLELLPSALDRRNSHGNTPLRTAIANDQLEVAKYLVSKGADPHQLNHGGSSLMAVATRRGCRETVLWLESLGLPVTVVELSAINALDRVEAIVRRDDTQLMARNQRRESALHAAARTGAIDVLVFLLDEGADANALVDRHGHGPLAVAVEAMQIDATDILLQAGADPDASAGFYGGTVLHRAINTKKVELVDLLLKYGSDPNRQDAAGKTAVHEAVSIANIGMVQRVLADSRVELAIRTYRSRQTPSGETAFELAIRRKKKKVAELLRERMSSATA